MTPCGACATAGHAGHRVPQQLIAQHVSRGQSTRISPGPEGNRLYRGRERGVEYAWGDNQVDRLSALTAELVRRQVAVIVASWASRFRVRNQSDHNDRRRLHGSRVKLGSVASLARPTGNTTVIQIFVAELAANGLRYRMSWSRSSV